MRTYTWLVEDLIELWNNILLETIDSEWNVDIRYIKEEIRTDLEKR